MRTSSCALDPFWFALKHVALADIWNCSFKLKTDGLLVIFLKNLKEHKILKQRKTLYYIKVKGLTNAS
jgi:hypothetical protein